MSFDSLMDEKRIFPVLKEFQAQANASDLSLYEKDEIWEESAHELEWIKKWDTVLEGKAPFFKWFSGGKLNISANCLDRHLAKNKTALIWEGEKGESRTFTYRELHKEVCRFANGLKGLGIKKGDCIAIYLPLIPEAIIAMQACARIGAAHTVVFGGFSSEALKERIQDSKAKLLITADGGFRKGALIPLKAMSDAVIQECQTIKHVVVVKRADNPVNINADRDVWYQDVLLEGDCPPEPMESEDLLFILYTSGTTGKPKGIVHTTAGYLLGAHMTTKWVFDLKDSDVYWCTADVGWITGHTYVAYGPFSNGATTLIYEGAPDFPEKDRFWQLIEKYKVTIFYTAPTAIRTFMKWGKRWPGGRDLSSLRLLGSVGEPINPEAWMWYYEHIGNFRCPVVDTWWQTETGSIMIAPLPGLTPLKPGSASRPLPGIKAEILNDEGHKEKSGLLAITAPWPSMLRGIYGDNDRYIKTYWSKWNGKYYFAGDGAKVDEDGDFWFLGRVDDVMNVSGHRIGTSEVESALVDYPSVAEAAVIGIFDEIKGQAIVAFVTLKDAVCPEPDFESILKGHVVGKIGAIARPKKIYFIKDLPKTRSGKIMRRLLRDIATGKVLGDTTTLADPSIIEELKLRYKD